MNTILDGVDLVVQYIMIYGPVLVSVITMITTVVVSIKRCKAVSNDSLKETKLLKQSMQEITDNVSAVMKQNEILLKENAELKGNMNKIYRK